MTPSESWKACNGNIKLSSGAQRCGVYHCRTRVRPAESEGEKEHRKLKRYSECGTMPGSLHSSTPNCHGHVKQERGGEVCTSGKRQAVRDMTMTALTGTGSARCTKLPVSPHLFFSSLLECRSARRQLQHRRSQAFRTSSPFNNPPAFLTSFRVPSMSQRRLIKITGLVQSFSITLSTSG